MNYLYMFLLAVAVLLVVAFTVWFGSFMDKQINELLNIQDEHETNAIG